MGLQCYFVVLWEHTSVALSWNGRRILAHFGVSSKISSCFHHCHFLSGLAQLTLAHVCVDQGRPKLSPDSPLLRSGRCGACSHHAPEISIEQWTKGEQMWTLNTCHRSLVTPRTLPCGICSAPLPHETYWKDDRFKLWFKILLWHSDNDIVQ